MFLTLDSSFTDDFEKIKRIATDVQQFCIASDEFSEIITEVAIPQPQAINGNGSIVATTTLPQQDIVTTSNSALINSSNSRPNNVTATKATKSPKKYKRSPNHNNNNNNNINMNNNNLAANGNLNLGPGVVNGQQQQRKERSLHYCSICSKGFKDKYSVNVHHRTHTGNYFSSPFFEKVFITFFIYFLM